MVELAGLMDTMRPVTRPGLFQATLVLFVHLPCRSVQWIVASPDRPGRVPVSCSACMRHDRLQSPETWRRCWAEMPEGM